MLLGGHFYIAANTTITRRDQEGNVVDVQKSQSGTAPAQPDAPEPEVRDPFN